MGGFTLVEMSVVLVIIGIILGAISIGKDVQRNAEYARIKQKFVDQWAVAYNAYVQRTGYPPGDMQQEPRWMVNGTNYNPNAAQNTVVSGGNMTNAAVPRSICHGTPPSVTGGRAVQTEEAFDLRNLMQRAGVRMPPAAPKDAKTVTFISIPTEIRKRSKCVSNGICPPVPKERGTSW
jgi:prepilin-type N-terminal cleavage/methylation domain-containing protein